MRRGARAGAVVAWAVAGCLLLAGCQETFHLQLGSPSDAEMLASVSLTEQDAAAGATFQPYEGGDEVAGRTSLDLCDADFPSEALRVGRNQVGIGDPSGSAWVSSEAILYRVPEEAEQAMAELAKAAQECPDDPVTPSDAGKEPLTWTFQDAPDADWPQEPGVNRQAYAFTVTSPDGATAQSTATYLQRGRMILALYATPPDAAATAIHNAPSPSRFVEVMANRLAALPESSVTEPNQESTPAGGDGFDA